MVHQCVQHPHHAAKIQTTVTDFSQWCNWAFLCSGMWSCIIGGMVFQHSREAFCFHLQESSGLDYLATHPMTQNHITEDQSSSTCNICRSVIMPKIFMFRSFSWDLQVNHAVINCSALSEPSPLVTSCIRFERPSFFFFPLYCQLLTSHCKGTVSIQCGICGGQFGIGKGFSPTNSEFPCH